jgi:hypothetical protein
MQKLKYQLFSSPWWEQSRDKTDQLNPTTVLAGYGSFYILIAIKYRFSCPYSFSKREIFPYGNFDN